MNCVSDSLRREGKWYANHTMDRIDGHVVGCFAGGLDFGRARLDDSAGDLGYWPHWQRVSRWRFRPHARQHADMLRVLDRPYCRHGDLLSGDHERRHSRDRRVQANIVGKGAGGEYSVPINGVDVQLDTHFDYPLVATYTNVAGANGGVVDPRFTAIDTAVNGDQGLYTIDFDITYDVEQMRSIPWQARKKPSIPRTMGSFRSDISGSACGAAPTGAPGSFKFTGFDQNTIAPFDAQYDNDPFPEFHASFPLADFGFVPNSGVTEYRLGILYNSVFGTLPAPSNTTAVHIYFDNLRLTQLIPAEHIDYNGNGSADPEDWSLFMAQFLVNDPPAPVGNPGISFDLVGDFGAGGTNGVVDFHDLQKFQDFYRLANPAGAAALSGSVPEPSGLVLLAIVLIGVVLTRSRRSALPLTMIGVGVLVLTLQRSAEAQLVEGWETLGNWTIGNSFAQAPIRQLARIHEGRHPRNA